MSDKALKEKRVLFIVAYNDYQDFEYRNVKNIIKVSGAKVEVCSSSLGTARGKYGGEIKIDLLINNIRASEFDAVVFIGGPGAVEYLNSSDAYAICRQAIEANKLLCAICMAPQILAKAGVLKNKKATVYVSETDKGGREVFEQEEVIYIEQDVVVDGGIITARGVEASEDFGKAIVNELNKN